MPVSSAEAARDWRAGNVGVRIAPPRTPAPPRTAQPIDLYAERARRERAEADLAERRVAELSGELLRVADVRRAAETVASRIRQRLLDLPDRMASLLEHRPGAFVRSTLNGEVHAALNELTAWLAR